MKKLLYTTIACAVASLMLLSVSSCKREDGVEQPVENSLVLSVISDEVSTVRAEAGDDTLNENKIDKLDIFIYDAGILRWHIKPADMTLSGNSVTVPIKADKEILFHNNTRAYDVYVIANGGVDFGTIAEGGNNLQALKDLVIRSTGFKTEGGLSAQDAFVMDGMVSKVITKRDADLGLVHLKRAASKIRVRIKEVNVPNHTYIPQTGTVQLKHFTLASALLDGGVYVPTVFDETEARTLTRVGREETGLAPFYAYAQDWSGDISSRAYVELLLPLTNSINGKSHVYRYIIPIAPTNLTGEQAVYNSCLKRNVLYDISVTVNILGSLQEEPVTLSGTYVIRDWSTREVLAEVKASDYLVVSETDVAMPNIEGYKLKFNSSIPNVTLVPGSLKATYTFIAANASTPTTVNVVGDQIPNITVAPGVTAGEITITSKIPTNLVPKDIEFKVTNGPLTETIKVRQTPGIYFTNEKSVRSSQFNSYQDMVNSGNGLRNAYTYIVTTSASGAKYPRTGEELILGYPPVDGEGNTLNDANVAKMVSPKFEMASQFGATVAQGYRDAKRHCNRYWERSEAGVEKRGWRLPTEAELKYIEQLQSLPANLQGLLMTGRWYWDAYSGNDAYEFVNNNTSGSNSTLAHVRCIRDIK